MRIGSVLGIPIVLHWSFIALFGVLGAALGMQAGATALGSMIALGIGLFGSVLLHELGHAMMGRAFGVRTLHITLFPFGGLAAMDRIPRNPMHEILVAVAGPAVNFVLVPVAYLGWEATGSQGLLVVAWLNLVMGMFNLIPAFPMDGGRMLRAMLVGWLGWVRASRVSISLGAGFAAAFVGVGVYAGVWSLALIGVFLLLVLRGERTRLQRVIDARAVYAANAVPLPGVGERPETPTRPPSDLDD